MTNDLEELLERLDYIEGKIGALNEACNDYLIANNKTRRIENRQTGQFAIEVEILKPVPTAIKSEAGMIANEIRSCLDALACKLAERNGQKPDGVYFPISKSEVVFNDDGKRKMRKLSAKDQDSIAALRPWKGGHNTLWALHEADRTRKHQRFVAHAASASGVNLGGAIFGGNFTMTDCVVNDVPVPHFETVNAILDPGKPTNAAVGIGAIQANPKLDVAYDEPPEIKGKPVPEVLLDFAKLVRAIVNNF